MVRACINLEEISVCDSQQAGKVGVTGGWVWGCHGTKVGVMDSEIGPKVCTVGQGADERYQGCHSCRAFPCTADYQDWCMHDDRLILIDSNTKSFRPRVRADLSP